MGGCSDHKLAYKAPGLPDLRMKILDVVVTESELFMVGLTHGLGWVESWV